MNGDISDQPPLQWSTQLRVLPVNSISLPGDKILLPPSALERLLEAAPLVVDSSLPSAQNNNNPAFDPFNPYSFAAERHARSQFRSHQRELPQPLTFRLVNPSNGRAVYAGIREFSAAEGTICLSPFLHQALGLATEKEHIKVPAKDELQDDDNTAEAALQALPLLTIHFKNLAKGTYVKLRPVEAGYDPEDWKSLLEDYLRRNFTTLSRNEVLKVPAGKSFFEFIVDEFKPNDDGICVVDTDLEVDIEALNEDQARETLKKIAEKRLRAPGTAQGSSPGGQIDLFRPQQGQVLVNEYVDYQLPSWNRAQGLEFQLDSEDTTTGPLNLFVSPFGPYQRAKPREDEHVISDFDDRPTKRIRLSPTNVELEDAEALFISVHAPAMEGLDHTIPRKFTLRASVMTPQTMQNSTEPDTLIAAADETICKNCKRPIPKQSLVLHENFCLRNNTLCPQGCGRVFQKRSEAWQNHWHCPHDSFSGDSSSTHSEHDRVFHQEYTCPACAYPNTFTSLPSLARHRTSTCPGKLILCRFCHLETPQEGNPDPSAPPDPELLLSGLTAHELADGARTTDCHVCGRITRLRDMDTHLKNHDFERFSRPTPRLCRNPYCGRTQDGAGPNGDTRAGERMGQGSGNDLGLCSVCFGPLYVSLYDPEGRALQRRIERRFLQQLMTGCGKTWCRNELCRTGRTNIGMQDKAAPAPAVKDALPIARPFLDGIKDYNMPLMFCVDETSAKRRALAEMLAAEGRKGPGAKEYKLMWCAAAVEAEAGNLDKSRNWLANFAPTTTEEQRHS